MRPTDRTRTLPFVLLAMVSCNATPTATVGESTDNSTSSESTGSGATTTTDESSSETTTSSDTTESTTTSETTLDPDTSSSGDTTTGTALNCGDGVFVGDAPPLGAETLVGTVSSAIVAYVSDGNNDGVGDIFVADLGALNVDPSIPGIYYLQGAGNHEFAEPVQLPGGGFQATSVVARAIADSVVDVAGAGLVYTSPGVYTIDVRIWRGNGDGTWNAPTILPSMTGWDVDLFDVNADDRLDVLGHVNGATVALASRDETFAGFTEYGISARLIVAGTDLDGDGNGDIVHGTHTGFAVRMGDGGGTFGAAMNVEIGAESLDLTVGDFDGDANIDVAAINANEVRVFAGDGTGNLAAGLELPGAVFPVALASPDYDGDGCADLTTFDSESGVVITWMGRDALAFTPPAEFPLFLTGSLRGGTAGDLDGDGIPDVVSVTQEGLPGGGEIVVLFSSG